MAENWMVKKSGGGVYGPADSETVRAWIREGRITAEDGISIEGTFDWKKPADVAEFAGISPAAGGPQASPAADAGTGGSSVASAGTTDQDMTKYGIGFGVLNLLIGGFMFIGGVIRGGQIFKAVGDNLGGLGGFIKGVAIFGIVVTTILWLPLFISGFMILGRKEAGRQVAVKSGQILMYAIPISFILSEGFTKIFSLYGLVIAILFFYVVLMWQNLQKSDFDIWFG